VIKLLYINVTINGKRVGQGVLQGSIISPILFNIYINPLMQQLNNEAPTYGYADDIAVLCENLMQTRKAIKIIEKWGRENNPLLNKNKSGILLFNLRRIEMSKWESKRNDIIEIPIISSYKYLGITLSKQFSVN
jgi:hypothetical protein